MNLRFGPFEVDLEGRRLLKRGKPITLREQSFQVLTALMERPGEIVTREELRRRLWPSDTFVDFEVALNSAVSRLRDALGDSADSPSVIETIPKRGYRFVVPIPKTACCRRDALREPNRRCKGRVFQRWVNRRTDPRALAD